MTLFYSEESNLLVLEGNQLELKKGRPNISFIKDSTFVKTLLVRKYATNETDRVEQQMGLF